MQTPPDLPPPGWFPDPVHPGRLRFWNGGAWEGGSLPEQGTTARRRPERAAVVVVGLAVVAWLAALLLPAYEPTYAASDTAQPETIIGGSAFLRGALLLWLPLGAWAAWWANVFGGIAAVVVVLGRAPRFGAVMAVVAVVVAPVATLLTSIDVDESGSNYYSVGAGPGLWLWLASIALVAVAAGLAVRHRRRV